MTTLPKASLEQREEIPVGVMHQVVNKNVRR